MKTLWNPEMAAPDGHILPNDGRTRACPACGEGEFLVDDGWGFRDWPIVLDMGYDPPREVDDCSTCGTGLGADR